MDIAAINILFAATSTKPTTSSAGSLVFLVVVVGFLLVMYRMFMRPRQRAAQAQRNTLMTLEPGEEVLTGAGIFGTVQHVQGDRVTLWTGTGSTITVLKRTIVRKIEEGDPDYEAGTDHDDDHGSNDSWNDDDTAALEAHQSHDDEPDTDSADETTSPSATGSTTTSGPSSIPPAAAPVDTNGKTGSLPADEAAADGHIADRIEELTSPDRPSEDDDR